MYPTPILWLEIGVAIMIGIALGIVAASLKLLIGYDRSYLGKD